MCDALLVNSTLMFHKKLRFSLNVKWQNGGDDLTQALLLVQGVIEEDESDVEKFLTCLSMAPISTVN